MLKAVVSPFTVWKAVSTGVVVNVAHFGVKTLHRGPNTNFAAFHASGEWLIPWYTVTSVKTGLKVAFILAQTLAVFQE